MPCLKGARRVRSSGAFLFATLFSMGRRSLTPSPDALLLGVGALCWLVNLVHWLPSIAVGVRRLHDIGGPAGGCWSD
ncbi:protein of unknown function (plasmid) [Methylocella tundrae]|uniref:Uncharacterized protein n=1 Tax=Methylocella tundrae TaxID=227605 RepID=A0A4U8Z7S8_METTU|nr:protein of unknown function [Methylocella tundrae]